jgi:phosphate transport system substrate-binding protein
VLVPLDADDPGELGPFTLQGRLGSGPVYLGRSAEGTAVAVRMLPGEFHGDPVALGRVRGAHVAALVDAADGWLATEYVDGPALDEVAPLPAADAQRTTAAVAAALVVIHAAGLAHGDLTAANVLMPADGPRVVGFGMVDGDPAADVYALGGLITLMAGEHPPEPLRGLAARCLAADAADRPAAAEVVRLCRTEPAGDPLAYDGVAPPSNPLDLSAGIPSDAAVGPIAAPPQADAGAEDPLAYPAAAPPDNPLDLSAGIPGGSIVGPIPPDATAEEPEPVSYPAAEPPANPLDLSAGIPNDSIVGPIPPDATATEPEPLAYAATSPPPNPLDLSTGIPGDSIVGPIPPGATADGAAPPARPAAMVPADAGPLGYPAAEPPANPLDLSAGIPADAVVGPIPAGAAAPAGPATPLPIPRVGEQPAEPPVAASAAITAPPIDPRDLEALRAAADEVAAAAATETAAVGATDRGHVIEPVAYAPPTEDTTTVARPFSPVRLRRRPRLLLAGLAAALLLAAAATVPLVADHTTAGTPVAVPESARPAEGGAPRPGSPSCSGTKNLDASGSILQRDAVNAIAQQWVARCAGSTVDYTPGGTAFGVQQFAAGETDFAVADHVLGANQGEIAAAAARCAGAGAPANKDLVLQVPLVLTPLVITYDLPGLDRLRLDAPTVAAIFAGRVKRWNDRAVAKLNPHTRLPATPVTVVARTGLAQTTQTFQEYLTAAGGWRTGDGPEFTGKAAVTHNSDSEVLASVRQTAGAVGYVPAGRARAIDSPAATLVTGGKPALPDSGAVNAAVEAALLDIVDYAKLPEAIYRAEPAVDGTVPYPLVHVGYVAACTSYRDPRTAAAIRDFLVTALGMQVSSASGYQLPFGRLRAGLVDLVERTY